LLHQTVTSLLLRMGVQVAPKRVEVVGEMQAAE